MSLGRLKIFLPNYRVWEGFTLKTVDMCPRYRSGRWVHTGHCGHVTPNAGSVRWCPPETIHVTLGIGFRKVSLCRLWNYDPRCMVWCDGVTLEIVEM